MEVAPPSQNSKKTLRRHFYVSQSQSQPNSPKEDRNSCERKSIHPKRISLLSGTANATTSIERMTPFNKNPLNKVSDFYDKTQIKDAIYSIDTLRDRIKFVDSILKRRVEIKEIEDQARFERASPTVAKAGQKLKHRVLVRTQNKSRRSFFLENLKGLSPSNSLASLLAQSEAVSRASPNYIHIESPAISPVYGTFRELSFTSSVLVRAGEAKASARVEPVDSVRKDPVNGDIEIKRSNLRSSVSTNAIKKDPNILSFLAHHHVKEAEEPGSCLVFENDENKPSTKDSSTGFRAKGSRRSILKGESNRSKAGSLTRDIYELGGQELEKDIYKYLVKHDKKQDASQIVENVYNIKEPLMRDIEAKAKTKFISFLDKKKQSNYMLPNSFALKSHKDERVKSLKPQKCVSFQNNLQPQESEDKKVIKRNGSSSLVRRVKQEVFHGSMSTPNSPKEPKVNENNESFASVTEANLDKLYRSSYNINKTLSLLDSQIYDLTDRDQFKKWDNYKQKKEKVLKENSKETLRQIYKKNFRKEF